jgi:hypothetical protein
VVTYTTQFAEQLGSSNEVINATFQYCEDFTGDGANDIKVSLSLAPGSNSGTEDMIGVAFDIQNDAVAGLSVTDIQRATANGTLSTFTPTTVIGANQVSDGGPLDPGFNTSGGGSDEPYDVGIKFSDEGSGEGIVQSASFVLTGTGDLDGEALLENTDWWVRLQSTDGGEESAKTGGAVGDLPPCEDEVTDYFPTMGKGISNVVIYTDNTDPACDTNADGFYTVKVDDFASDAVFDLDEAWSDIVAYLEQNDDCFNEEDVLGAAIKSGKNAFASGTGVFSVSTTNDTAFFALDGDTSPDALPSPLTAPIVASAIDNTVLYEEIFPPQDALLV